MKNDTMRMERMFVTALECAVVFLVTGAMAAASPLAYCGFNSGEDPPAYALGEIEGQGSATGGWAGAWASTPATGVFRVVEGGCPAKGPCPGDPDQHLAMYGGTSGTYHTDRNMDPWSGDFKWEFCVRLSDNADGQRDQTQIQFKNAGGKRPLNIKFGASNYAMFLLNDQAMIVQSGDAKFPDMVPLGTAAENWVHIAITCDWDTATFDLYWENTLGGMDYIGRKVGWKDSTFSGDVTELEVYSPKAYGNMNVGMDLDAVHIVPEPVTVALLGLGALAMGRRRPRYSAAKN